MHRDLPNLREIAALAEANRDAINARKRAYRARKRAERDGQTP